MSFEDKASIGRIIVLMTARLCLLFLLFCIVITEIIKGVLFHEDGVSLIEIYSENPNLELNPNYDENSVIYGMLEKNETLQYITFNESDIMKIEVLKQKLHEEEELQKLKKSGLKCYYGLKCLYNINDDVVENLDGEYPSELENDDFERFLGDENKYKYFTLDNGLRVFLLSNDMLYTSSLSLGVKVGNGYDPEHLNGLSFLITEMIFKKGEEKEDVRDFRTLIDENNGYFNIDTRTYHTIYSYDIKSKLFQDSILSFINCLTRELSEVDSLENSINDVSEMVRLFSRVDILREQQLIRSLSNPNHTFHRFPYGNNETLVQVPGYYNISTLEEAIKLKNERYIPKLMTLSVATNLSIDTVEKLIRNYFSVLKNPQEELSVKNKEDPLSISEDNGVGVGTENEVRYIEKEKENNGDGENVNTGGGEESDEAVRHPYYHLIGKFIEFKSKDSNGYMKLEFPIPRQNKLWRKKAGHYIKYFLSRNFKGGLLDYLTYNGWVRNLDVNVINDDSGFSLLVIKVTLVNSNRDSIVRILQAIFSVLDSVLAAKCDENLFEQIRRVEQGYLKQYQCTGYYKYSKEIISSLFETECYPNVVLKVPYEFEKIECSTLEKLIRYINPYNMVILISSRTFYRNSSDFLLSNEVFGESVWHRFRRNFMSLVRRFKRCFLRPSIGEYPRYIKEYYLNGEYLISDIPENILKLLAESNNEFSQKYIGFNITEITINYPELYNIYTYDIPQQSHPELLFDSLSSYIKYTTKTSEVIDETYLNKVLSTYNEYLSPLAYYTYYYPTNVGIPRLGVSSRIFAQPKSVLAYGFQSFPKTNARLVTLSYLFSKSFKYALDQEYRDGIAEMEFKSLSELQVSFLGIEIRWTNYNYNFDRFFNSVLSGLSNYGTFVTNSHLSQAKSDFESKLDKLSSLNNAILAEDISFEILNFYYMTLSMFKQAIKSVKLRDVIDFANYIINVGTIETLVIGNCTPMQVNSYLIKLSNALGRKGSIQTANNLRYLNMDKIPSFLRRAFSDGFEKIAKKVNEDGFSTNETVAVNNETSNISNKIDLDLHLNNATNSVERRISTIEDTEKSFLSEGTYKGRWVNRISMDNLSSVYRNAFYLKQSSNRDDNVSVVYLEIQIGSYTEEMLAFLKLVTNLNIRGVFKEFVSEKYPNSSIAVKQYAIKTSYLLFKIMVSSPEYNVVALTSLAIQFYYKYFKMVTSLVSREEFKKAVNLTISSIDIPHTDIDKLLEQYTVSLLDRKSSLNWKYIQVAYLLNLNYNEFLNNWSIFSNPPKLIISVLKQNASPVEVAEANSFELEGFLRLNTTSFIKKISVESNFITQ
ncbi:secreted insulinase like peptidase [Cryptosporidium bovis]|uniref:secreted insulinase like peptidase n=1 Tax=Cryptosporidium bovis TaxID=310047 RepID=UPI00351A55CC|nr:secreted insulinase like peptidase [Cryptosporidium bovis]